ncbi:alcohol dehydrogenase GroES domain-containing protein [Annulohypoxylon maeteangense]|uniref:alcohol dehydrogenase GroES domain-containing protein n=1 Tax=Annulohypoxylon maeteangense TaxID=1927788 RepID=UPI0020076157|nr:alcohol dehydrogenase GroES domain-containing protein [Annulohypoxylon maeteangense]KAI0887744.1 alcohol dehydrogenase GroES domain-containing protein [Annulohypoxylon maeteangense]
MSSPNSAQLPSTYKALVFESASINPKVTSLPSPRPGPGTVIVKPLYSWVFNYAADIFTNGNPRNYPISFPIIGGGNAIGRVAATSADTRNLTVGDLVIVEPIIKERDGAHLPNTRGLGLSDNGTWAELVQIPLENAMRVDEAALKRNGIAVKDVAFYAQLVVPYGGFRDVGLTAGGTVLITPATGNFGGAAVHVALAMGARVIAMGRNEKILAELKALAPGRVDTVVFSGDLEADVASIAKYGPVDVFQDLTPPMATNTSHIQAGILSVRTNGRVNLMGNVKDLEIPYRAVVYRGLRIQGTLMYTREQALDMLKLIETGTLKLGPQAGLTTKRVFKLEDGVAALEFAAKEAGAGRAVYFAPNEE